MKVIRAGLIRDSGFLPPVNVFGLGGIIYAPIFHRRMGPACVYICEEEDRYFDCEMAPPVAGKSIGRSIGCKRTQWFCTVIS